MTILQKQPYSLQFTKWKYFHFLPAARSSHYGINSAQIRDSLLWNNLPVSVKETVPVKEMKQKLNHKQKIHGSCVACQRFQNFCLLCQY